MKIPDLHAISRRLTPGLAFLAALATPGAFAADNGKPSKPIENYQQQRADCVAGRTAEDRATCLREAGAAQQEAKRGKLDNGGDYTANALQRCQPLPPNDRAECERRVRGEGSSSGSVGGGGIYRELRTTIPGTDGGSDSGSK